MTARQRAWPREWLMTDERIGDRLWSAIARLPDGDSGIVFRHYRTPHPERAALASQVAAACRARGIALAVARDAKLAQQLGADLVHNPPRPGTMPFSMSVHSCEEGAAARERGAALVFVSPVHPTRSHPGEGALGPALAARIAETATVPAIALGGMDRMRFAALPRPAFHGWAAIDAWLREAD